MTPPGFGCPRRIGFLFPHPCGRTTPIGCPDCDNGQVADPYAQRTDRGAYSDYDDYDSSDWQEAYAADSSGAAAADLTEADGENLVLPEEFEGDPSAS